MVISKSTEGFRFDMVEETSDGEEIVVTRQEKEIDKTALSEIEEATHDQNQPVVKFALEWCEFCWSVRKIFKKFGIDYRAIEIDSVAYKEGNRGGKIFDALEHVNNWSTIPQIYIGGEFIGDCTDLIDKINDRSIGKLLKENNIPFDESVKDNRYDLLPAWLHPR